MDTFKQNPGEIVLLPPGLPSSYLSSPSTSPINVIQPPPPPTSLAPPAPTAPSTSVFLWLPNELQVTTENLIVRTELAREATRRAQIGLAQRMAREVLKLPFDFIALHGT